MLVINGNTSEFGEYETVVDTEGKKTRIFRPLGHGTVYYAQHADELMRDIGAAHLEVEEQTLPFEIEAAHAQTDAA